VQGLKVFRFIDLGSVGAALDQPDAISGHGLVSGEIRKRIEQTFKFKKARPAVKKR
jgi:hypothetical protein